MTYLGKLRFTLRQLMVTIALLAAALAWLPWPVAILLVGLTIAVALCVALAPTRRRLLVGLSIAGLAIVAWTGLLFGSGALWVGTRTIVLSFVITDSVSGQRVPNASVRLFSCEPNWSTGRNCG